MFRSAAGEPDVYTENLRVPKQKPPLQTHAAPPGAFLEVFSVPTGGEKSQQAKYNCSR